jgi:hypothetical protein
MSDGFLGKLGAIVGIGVGAIELELVRSDFRPGDSIDGRLTLKLDKPTEAKRLVVGVRAIEKRTTRGKDADGRPTTQTENVTFFQVEQPLDGKRTYRGDSWDIHLKLPSDVLGKETALPGGTLGDVVRVVSALTGSRRAPLHWTVFAFLEIPWKANVKASRDITVSPR